LSFNLEALIEELKEAGIAEDLAAPEIMSNEMKKYQESQGLWLQTDCCYNTSGKSGVSHSGNFRTHRKSI
jgi:hypothetical protein